MSSGPAASLGIVIPALNEAAGLPAMLHHTRACLPHAPIVVADGGSTDDTPAVAAVAGARVIAAPRGRRPQCRAGAMELATEWLLFLHADTLLPRGAAEVIARFAARPAAQIATFRLRFDEATLFLRASAWFTRFDSVFTRFGDQGILIRRSFYDELGGFPPWPLLEDVALLQRARACGRIYSLPAQVTTSSRRFRARNPVRQQVRNAALLLRYLAGTPPAKLAEIYRRP